MNIQQEGLGYCNKCGGPKLQKIGQREGVCLACNEAEKPKAGRTVVVTGETGKGTDGLALGHEVSHHVGPDSPLPPLQKPTDAPIPKPITNSIKLEFSLSDLEKPNILLTIMQALYDGIDNLPPPATLKETKKAIAIQNIIEAQIKKLKGE